MKKSKVYTKSGDKGQTSLVSGKRLEKSDQRIDLYGDVDELNSAIGYGVSLLKKNELVEGVDLLFLQQFQSALFDLGSRLACEEEFWEKYNLPDITLGLLNSLEFQIDSLDEELEPMRFFILPGGNEAAAYFHVCRTICRRVERKLVGFELTGGKLPSHGLKLINRASDYFFVLSRYINKQAGEDEVKWIPQKS